MDHEAHILQEELLHAWMQMSVFIRGNRLLTDFSFNEIMICGLLFRQQESGATPLTATQASEVMALFLYYHPTMPTAVCECSMPMVAKVACVATQSAA